MSDILCELEHIVNESSAGRFRGRELGVDPAAPAGSFRVTVDTPFRLRLSWEQKTPMNCGGRVPPVHSDRRAP
jgi:hypothetical protein